MSDNEKLGSYLLEENLKYLDLHDLILDHCIQKEISQNHLLAYLSLTLSGTMALGGYDDEFFEKTLDRMRDHFKKIKERKKNIRKRHE